MSESAKQSTPYLDTSRRLRGTSLDVSPSAFVPLPTTALLCSPSTSSFSVAWSPCWEGPSQE